MQPTATPEADAAARAKPLNARTLDALPAGLKVWDDQIAYLDDVLALDAARRDAKMPPIHGAAFITRIRMDREALVRAREWLASKLAAELAGRGE